MISSPAYSGPHSSDRTSLRKMLCDPSNRGSMRTSEVSTATRCFSTMSISVRLITCCAPARPGDGRSSAPVRAVTGSASSRLARSAGTCATSRSMTRLRMSSSGSVATRARPVSPSSRIRRGASSAATCRWRPATRPRGARAARPPAASGFASGAPLCAAAAAHVGFDAAEQQGSSPAIWLFCDRLAVAVRPVAAAKIGHHERSRRRTTIRA